MPERSNDDVTWPGGSPHDFVGKTLRDVDSPKPEPIDLTQLHIAGSSDDNDSMTVDSPRRSEAVGDPEPVEVRFNGRLWFTENDQPTIGGYRVERCLGHGAFGAVYLASDDALDRSVAIKVPHAAREDRPEWVDDMIHEARILARLEHEGIVPIYHVGRLEDGRCYIVSKFIDGTSLAARLHEGRAPFEVVARWIAGAALALDFAHAAGVVHRDVKPANLLLDSAGNLYVADFGLALKESDEVGGEGFAGTPSYTSPEQARREGHRVDPRSDLFSLGVVLYEALTGTNPFQSGQFFKTLENVASLVPPPPSHLDPEIPGELDRICVKAMAKRSDDRYPSGHAFATDLLLWIDGVRAPDAKPEGPPSITPRGLRAFEAADSEAFLDLVPGPRGRDGMPESLRFWKSRIEGDDGAETFRVGVLYGPSGSGKSSLVRAGLLPRLSSRIRVVYVEADTEETEPRLVAALGRVVPEFAGETDPSAILRELRRGRGLHSDEKVLIVLDQFEQWLFGRRDDGRRVLEEALRQCDGTRVQALVLVRDEFWMDLTRFAHALEVRLVEGENSAAVDLFDLEHARKVLVALGRAHNRLPPSPWVLSKAHEAFLDQALDGLARDRRVVCVRLVLLAELLRAKPWTPATLRGLGGVERIGAMILDEAFSANSTHQRLRTHRRAAREVLARLLPERGVEIKGHMVSRDDLLAASGYAAHPEAFDELMWGLDQDLRVVTPAQGETDTLSGGDHPRSYQLTHDSLVSDLRDWLLRDRQQTMRGRAELRLQEFATLYDDGHESRFLPSCAEWVALSVLTTRGRRTEIQRKMLREASKRHLCNGVIGVCILGFIGAIGYWKASEMQARSLVNSLRTAEIERVPGIVGELRPYARWAVPMLRRELSSSSDAFALVPARIALLETAPVQAEFLVNPMISESSSAAMSLTIRDALSPHRARVTGRLWQALEDPRRPAASKLRAAIALAEFDPPTAGQAADRWAAVGGPVADALVQAIDASPADYAYLVPAVDPIRASLTPRIKALYRVPDGGRRSLLANLFVDLARDDPESALDLALDSDPDTFEKLLPLLANHRKHVVPLLQGSTRLTAPAPSAPGSFAAKRRAIAAIALIRLGAEESAWPVFRIESEPDARTFLLHHSDRYGVPLAALIDRLKSERDPRILSGLLLATAMHTDLSQSAGRAGEIGMNLLDHPDAGVRGAAEAMLKRIPGEPLAPPTPTPLAPDRTWYVTRDGHVMVIVDARHVPSIGRAFAIASTEVSLDQIREMIPNYWVDPARTEDMRRSPAGVVKWATAIDYCQWLDRREGIAQSQSPYPPEGARGQELLPTADRTKTGFRLPTAAEFEFACRGRTVTDRYFGNDISVIHEYAQFGENTKLRPVGSLLPNDYGLFDMNGNVAEWTADLHTNGYVLIAGGSLNSFPSNIVSSYTQPAKPDVDFNTYGFRLVRTIELDANGRPK